MWRWQVDNSPKVRSALVFIAEYIAGWCNGNTSDFGSLIHGSSPCPVVSNSQTLVFPKFSESSARPAATVYENEVMRLNNLVPLVDLGPNAA